jgi:tellurite resistance protein
MRPVVGESVMAIAVAVWVLLVLLFIAKWMWRRAEAVREVEDPVQCCFVGLLPVSTMLISLVGLPYGYTVAAALGIAGGAGQLAFAVYRTGQLWAGEGIRRARRPFYTCQPQAAILSRR